MRATVATQGKRLIALSETERHWMTEEEVLALRRAKHETGRLGLGFMDITDDPFPARTAFRRAFPTEPSQQAVVQPLLASMEPDSVMDFLTPFTTFNNRVRLLQCNRRFMKTSLTLSATFCFHGRISIIPRTLAWRPLSGCATTWRRSL